MLLIQVHCGYSTWDRGWRHWWQDRILSFGDHAYPVLVGVTVEIIPGGIGTVAVGHHLHAVLSAIVVVGFPGAPVGVRQRGAIAPGVSCAKGTIAC